MNSNGKTMDSTEDLKSIPLERALARLETSTEGLNDDEALRRVRQYGYNEIPDNEIHPFLKFLRHFWGPIPWMIEAAAVLSALVHHWPDFTIILILLLANAGVGFWEEYQAGNAIEALKSRLALKARVRRNARWISVPSRELVPGDVVRIRLGDILPADLRLLQGDPIEVDQSALTGESLPVTCKTGDAVYSGSVMRQGEANAVVYGTGLNTYFGKTAQLVQKAQTVSHFQRAVLKIGDYLILLAVALVALILTVSLFRGDRMSIAFQFALVLTVAAIPVAMPTVLSVTMAVGARLLATKKAIVSRLSSIEELAGMDVLCSDKTGTLTQNTLTMGTPFVLPGVNVDDVMLAAALASRDENEDPIDLAVLKGIKDPALPDNYKIVNFKPFDPVRKRTEATVRRQDGSEFRVTKGAPQVIQALIPNRRDNENTRSDGCFFKGSVSGPENMKKGVKNEFNRIQ